LNVHTVVITQYLAFLNWLCSLSNTHSYFLHVFLQLDISFLFSTEYSSIAWIYHNLSIDLLKIILVSSKFWQLWIKLL
jgi:hypothetical protein